MSISILVPHCIQIMSELQECPCCSMSEGQQHKGLRSGDICDALCDAEGLECGLMWCLVQCSQNRLVTLGLSRERLGFSMQAAPCLVHLA